MLKNALDPVDFFLWVQKKKKKKISGRDRVDQVCLLPKGRE